MLPEDWSKMAVSVPFAVLPDKVIYGISEACIGGVFVDEVLFIQQFVSPGILDSVQFGGQAVP